MALHVHSVIQASPVGSIVPVCSAAHLEHLPAFVSVYVSVSSCLGFLWLQQLGGPSCGQARSVGCYISRETTPTFSSLMEVILSDGFHCHSEGAHLPLKNWFINTVFLPSQEWSMIRHRQPDPYPDLVCNSDSNFIDM